MPVRDRMELLFPFLMFLRYDYFLLVKCTHLFYIPTGVSLPPFLPFSCLTYAPSTPPLFMVRKGRASHWCQQNITNQVAVGISSSLFNKAEKGNRV